MAEELFIYSRIWRPNAYLASRAVGQVVRRPNVRCQTSLMDMSSEEALIAFIDDRLIEAGRVFGAKTVRGLTTFASRSLSDFS